MLALGFTEPTHFPPGAEVRENKYACGELEYQLEEYFARERTSFTVDVRLDGTSFQKAVWSRLIKIEYGETATYSHIAQKIGRRDAARAVGNAVGANPVVILVPCHRVLPVHGGIGNYAVRGLDAEIGRRVKASLLRIEGAINEEDDLDTPELEFETA